MGTLPEGPSCGGWGLPTRDLRARSVVLASWAASSGTLSALYLRQSPALLYDMFTAGGDALVLV